MYQTINDPTVIVTVDGVDYDTLYICGDISVSILSLDEEEERTDDFFSYSYTYQTDTEASRQITVNPTDNIQVDYVEGW